MDNETVNSNNNAPKQISYAKKIPQNLLDKCRVLSSREGILDFLPDNITFCEVGVALGDFTALVLSKCRVKKFIAIDLFHLHYAPNMWGGRVARELAGRNHLDFYKAKFNDWVRNGTLEAMAGDSAKMLAKLAPESVDVFYIDANHSYENVCAELAEIKKIMKPDTIIIFNDYIMQDWICNVPYGVVQAANEFMIDNDMEMIFFALAPGMFCDVAIQKRGRRA